MGPGYDGMVVRYTAAGELVLSLHLGGEGHDNLLDRRGRRAGVEMFPDNGSGDVLLQVLGYADGDW